jgi:hypothetical protein
LQKTSAKLGDLVASYADVERLAREAEAALQVESAARDRTLRTAHGGASDLDSALRAHDDAIAARKRMADIAEATGNELLQKINTMRSAEMLADRDGLQRQREAALATALAEYPPAARGIRGLVKTELALRPLVARADATRNWNTPKLAAPVILTQPNFLALLSLPNVTADDDRPRFGHYWHPSYRLEEIDGKGPFVEMRDDIIAPFRDARGEDLKSAIRAAGETIRAECMRHAASIVAALLLWSKAWVAIERFNDTEDRRRLGLAEIEPLSSFNVVGRGEMKALPRTVFIPALGPNESPLWDCSADLRALVERA